MLFGGPASRYGSSVPWILPIGMADGIQTSLCIRLLKWSSNPCCPSLPTEGAERWIRDNSAFHSVSDAQLAFPDFLLPPTTQVWKSLSRFWLFVTLWTVACRAPLSMEFSRQKQLEWVAIPFSRVSSQPRDQTQVSHTAGGFFTVWATREAQTTQGCSSFHGWSVYCVYIPW